MATPAKARRTRKVEQPGNPDQVTEAKQIEQQHNIEKSEEEELLSNVRFVTTKEPAIGTVEGNFVLTENGWSQHAPRTAVVEEEQEEDDSEEDEQE